ncbi:impact family protein [Diplodia corticola]|uniref:Impact family protein n=1 Tax=Diplodia corticola TaxID=236234 RepID=A0A1J9QZT6_9PEZI|nr:impact family protein [Diplodia corticola]OJD33506.1 impact family protein [Diplodia corticola]
MNNQDLEDEITSINSIYDETTLTAIANNDNDNNKADHPSSIHCALRLPSLPSITLRLAFPADYPAAPPAVLGTQSVGDDAPKGFGTRVVDAVRDVLARVYRPGEPCVFDVLDEVDQALQAAGAGALLERDAGAGSQQEEDVDDDGLTTATTTHHDGKKAEDDSSSMTTTAQMATSNEPHDDNDPPPPSWTLSAPLSEKKSVFLGRAAPCASVADAKRAIAHLLATDKKAARATHNISAWRIRGTREDGREGTTYQDCDDDGEAAAGGRLLHLLQLMDAWDVVVVVTRWYGGVQLGPDRFRLINQAAREAVVAGGFVREEKKEGGGGGGGKKKGKK